VTESFEFIVPGTGYSAPAELGEPPPNTPTPADRRYWYVQCPACKGLHHRMVKQEWEDDPESVLTDTPVGRVVMYHFFVCASRHLHFKIAADWPFNILYETNYQPKPLTDVDGVEYFTRKREE
jgi:hypothetical protein